MSVKSIVMDQGMRAASTRKRLVMMEVVMASATVFLSGYVPSLVTSARSYLAGEGATHLRTRWSHWCSCAF